MVKGEREREHSEYEFNYIIHRDRQIDRKRERDRKRDREEERG